MRATGCLRRAAEMAVRQSGKEAAKITKGERRREDGEKEEIRNKESGA